jgi:hypothetical protein
LYPFQKKEFVGESKWYEKFGVGLNTQFRGQSSFYDSLFTFSPVDRYFSMGAQHSIRFHLALPQLDLSKLHQVSAFKIKCTHRNFTVPGIILQVSSTLLLTKVFYSRNDVAFSLGVSSAVFGTFSKFGKNSSVKALRHVIRPSVSASYKPDKAKG